MSLRLAVVCAAILFGFVTDCTDAGIINICSLPGVPMYCNCDELETDEASYVSCFVSTNISRDDPHWQGFSQQKMIKSLAFNSRTDSYLSYVPGKVLRTLHHLEHILFSGSTIRVLTSMSFSNLTAVRSINVESNQIEEIEPRAFAFLPMLKKLELSDNKISRLSAEVFEDLPSLETLYLENNLITYIDDSAFASIPNLRELDLFNNQLLHLRRRTLYGLESLVRLDMSRNNLTRLDDYVFSGTPQLADLEIGQNRIKTISEKALAELPRLLSLRIKDNLLTTLPENVFAGCPNILSMSLTDNLLTAFPKSMLMSLNNRTEASFAIYIKGNPLYCSCDLGWTVEYSKTSKNVIFREELKSLYCVDEDTKRMNLIKFLTSDELDCSDEGVHQKLPTTTEKYVLDDAQNDPEADDDDDEDEDYDDDEGNNDSDNDHNDVNNDRRNDNDNESDEKDFDTDDHSVNVDDDPDMDPNGDNDDDSEEDEDSDYIRRRPYHPAITESVNNLKVSEEDIEKKDVVLTASAVDEHSAPKVNDVPDNASSTLAASLSLLLCLTIIFR